MRKQTEDRDEVLLTYVELKTLSRLIKDDGGIERFLVSRGVIKITSNHEWVVQVDDTCVGTDAIFGYKHKYNIPFVFWKEVIDQVQDFEYKEKVKNNEIDDEVDDQPEIKSYYDEE